MLRRTRNRSWLVLALLTLAAFALRVTWLDAQSLWYDEGVTAAVARRGIAELTRWTADDIQPPLYYYTVALWGRLAGWSEWSLRFPSVFFGTLAVPLLAAVTIALTRRRAAGLLTGSLAAFHPLLLYYSQEARMYTMLIALGVLLTYLVIHSERALDRPALHWSAYIIAATAAAYTHYFAFFLLLALATAYLIDQLLILLRLQPETPRDDPESDLPPTVSRRPLLGFVLANLAVAVLYLPWFSTLVTRLAQDASYWDGQFKIDEALRHIAISFTSGETVLESQATQLLIPYGLLTLTCALALLWRVREQPRTILYAALWLALPIVTVLMLASLTPKFNARYVMIALPGLLLLWGAGLAALIRLRGWEWTDILRTPFQRLPSLIALIVVILLHAGFFYADHNWFFDPAFTKSEWRELSRYLRRRIPLNPQTGAPEDLIILVSGHAWPVWNYYAPDLPPLRLPNIEILDVNAVLDVSQTAAPLQAALADHKRVWLVQWQQGVVDPMGVVPLQLLAAGREEQVRATFWQLRLRHFVDIDAARILHAPATTSAPDAPTAPPVNGPINVGNQIRLLGHQVTAHGDLLLFWQTHPDHSDPIPDLYIAGETFTAEGLPFHRLEDRRPVGYTYPTFRWRADQVNVGALSPESWAGPGALPARYRVRLAVYDINGDLAGLDILGPQGQPLGKFITLDIDLPVPTPGPTAVDLIAFAPILPNLQVELLTSTEQAEPGQAFAVEFHWFADTPIADAYDLRLRWRFRDGEEVAAEQTLRLTPQLPTARWPTREMLRNVLQLRPPLNLPPADYWLEISLTAPYSNAIRVPFRVLGSSRIFIPPPYRTPVDVYFGDQLHLLGLIEPLQFVLRTGEQVPLTFVWQALHPPQADYTAAIQWLGADGRPAAQADLLLPGGSGNWLAGQVELQTAFLTAPAQPGDYRLVVAVYNAAEAGLPRLISADGRDLIDLGLITIQP